MCFASPNVSLSGKTTRLVAIDEGGDQFQPPARGTAELIAAFSYIPAPTATHCNPPKHAPRTESSSVSHLRRVRSTKAAQLGIALVEVGTLAGNGA